MPKIRNYRSKVASNSFTGKYIQETSVPCYIL